MWFLWDGRSVLLFSLPKTRKVRNIEANSTAVLALDAADQGYDVVIVDGEAQLLRDATITGSLPAFVEKYAAIPRRWPPEEWAEKFTEAIRVAPTRLRAWRTRPGIPAEYASAPTRHAGPLRAAWSWLKRTT